MGLYDSLTCKHPAIRCSEGHDLSSEEFQTYELGCTMGHWELNERLTGEPGNYGRKPARPFTGQLVLCTNCRQCPAFVETERRGLLECWVEMEVEILADEVRSVKRISPSTAEWIAEESSQGTSIGPMAWSEAWEQSSRGNRPK